MPCAGDRNEDPGQGLRVVWLRATAIGVSRLMHPPCRSAAASVEGDHITAQYTSTARPAITVFDRAKVRIGESPRPLKQGCPGRREPTACARPLRSGRHHVYE